MGNKERQEELLATDQKFTRNKRKVQANGFQPDFSVRILTLLIFLGIILEINNVIFSYAASYLLVSTSSLLLSSQLGFNLVLSVIMGKQKITFWNLTTVILITLCYILLTLNSNRERLKSLTEREYFIGFFCTISEGLLYVLYLAVVEKINKKVDCYEMVMEMQLVMKVMATALATVRMVILRHKSKWFQRTKTMKSTLKKKTKTTKSTLEKKNKQNHQNWATRKDKKNCMQQIKNLPETRVSTSSLLLSFQLGFNLVLSVIMGKQKITFWNLTTRKTKFSCTISEGLLYALYLAIVEKINKKIDCYEMVMEMQLVMEVTVTALVTVGMVFLDGFCITS
ncbi:hypothetical protein HN51_066831 [Arachis hypogaea]